MSPSEEGLSESNKRFHSDVPFIAQMNLWGYFVCVSCDFPQLRGQNEYTSWGTCVRHLVSSPRDRRSTPPSLPLPWFLPWCFIASNWRVADGRRLISRTCLQTALLCDSPAYNEPKLDLCWQSNVLPFYKTLFYPYTPYWIDLNCGKKKKKKKKVVQQIISISSPLWWTPRCSLQLLSAWDWPD